MKIQSKTHCTNLPCKYCWVVWYCINIEWRVSIFQWDNEFEKVCYKCAEEKWYWTPWKKVRCMPKNFIKKFLWNNQ
jgi:hypothetical protein